MVEPQIQLNNLTLTEHPVWPPGLKSVVLYGTEFAFDGPLNLPEGITSFTIDNCKIRAPLVLPESITTFHYGLMPAENFPQTFPQALRILTLRKFKAPAIPELPASVEQLRLTRVHLETPFTRLPIYLINLSLCQTNVTEFEEFPIGLLSLDIDECMVQRLPRLNNECHVNIVDSEIKRRN
jgi:hypothetical protein